MPLTSASTEKEKGERRVVGRGWGKGYSHRLNLVRLAAQMVYEEKVDWVINSRRNGEVDLASAELVSLLIKR